MGVTGGRGGVSTCCIRLTFGCLLATENRLMSAFWIINCTVHIFVCAYVCVHVQVFMLAIATILLPTFSISPALFIECSQRFRW